MDSGYGLILKPELNKFRKKNTEQILAQLVLTFFQKTSGSNSYFQNRPIKFLHYKSLFFGGN